MDIDFPGLFDTGLKVRNKINFGFTEVNEQLVLSFSPFST